MITMTRERLEKMCSNAQYGLITQMRIIAEDKKYSHWKNASSSTPFDIEKSLQLCDGEKIEYSLRVIKTRQLFKVYNVEKQCGELRQYRWLLTKKRG